MKPFLFLFLLLNATSLFCEEEQASFSLWDYHPLHVSAQTIQTANASVDAPQGGDVYFGKTFAYVSMLVPVTYTSYFIPRVEWVQFTLDWDKNPKFNETHFSYAQFSLLFYSKGMEKWRWIVRGEYNLDLKHFSTPSLYGLFSWLLWGAYELSEKWHYHIGATGYIGMEDEMTYPLLGIDYSPTDHWTLEAIFPITYSVQYHLNKNWRFSLIGRPMKERYRVGSHEPQPRSVFSYSSVGTEVNIHYEIPLKFEIEFYAGYNAGGNFYIKDQKGKNSLYTEVNGAPYLGGMINYGF